MRTLLLGLVLLSSLPALAQSREDKRASLVGLQNIAFKETGVAALGGGTAGSPYLLQVESAFKAAGIHVAELDSAVQKSIPVYELTCSAMDGNDGTVRVACEARLIRPVSLDGTSPPRTYAITWTSPLVVASYDHDRVTDLDKLTAKFVASFMEDWNAANPKAAPKKK
ncbi:MAG TPA: hypothetical protein VGO62_19035 [Myxococcota bacterium]|jgi:hypothetical protein